MKQLFLKNGSAYIENIPEPTISEDQVLIKNFYTAISAGTEMSGLNSTSVPLWKRAIQQPQNVSKAIDMFVNQGLQTTMATIQGKLAAGQPSGYSAVGEVISVGKNITDIKVGEHIASGGAKYANHAEYIAVPRNLCVKVPQSLDLKYASTVTLGAIAMQGIRRLNPTLGETIVIIGMGIIGQLSNIILQKNGCKVIAVDLDDSRLKLAQEFGCSLVLSPENQYDDDQAIRELTKSLGVDGVLITAASKSDEIISSAFKYTRKKGRVVIVGDIGLNLQRQDFYEKEIDVLISSSYGPGRYDNNYEEKGLDYPASYVRWTENRNMESYLEVINDIDISSLVTSIYSIDNADAAFSAYNLEGSKPMISLLEYPENLNRETNIYLPVETKNVRENTIATSLIGCGDFAKGVHIPNLQKLNDSFHLSAVMSYTNHNAWNTARQFNIEQATTNFDDILNNDLIDLVFICTRHIDHGKMVLDSLKKNKHVFVEKPLCLSKNELIKIKNFFSDINPELSPLLLTGFNRRFSPLVSRIKKHLEQSASPLSINYMMNAGYISQDHWIQSAEGGGRNLGEACHIYDLFTYLTNSRVQSVKSSPLNDRSSYFKANDNFITVITFEDGSVASLNYSSNNSSMLPKEQMTIHSAGTSLFLDDYKSLKIFGKKEYSQKLKSQNKGHYEELLELANSIKSGDFAIPLWQQFQATEIAIMVEEQIHG